MKLSLNENFEMILDGLYKKDTDKVNIIFNDLLLNKNHDSKLVILSTLNALLYSTFNNKCNDRCEEIFNENFLKIHNGDVSSNLFESYLEIIDKTYNRQNDYISLAYDYVEENIDKPLTLEKLASELHISKNYFSNLFKKVTGMRFSKYVNYRRIEKAKYFLENTDYSLYEISQRCGYNSQSHFSTTFLQFENTTPGAYRYSFK